MRNFLAVTLLLLSNYAHATEYIQGIVLRSQETSSVTDGKDPNIVHRTRRINVSATDGKTYEIIHSYSLRRGIPDSDFTESNVRAVPVRDATHPAIIKEADIINIKVEKGADGVLRSRAGNDIILVQRTSLTTTFGREDFQRQHGPPRVGSRVGYAR